MYDKEFLDAANVKTAVRLNQDRITKADNAIRQAEGEKKVATHNIFMLNSYTKIIAPYIKKAMQGTKATDVDVAINDNYFDVVFYILGTELRTRIVAKINDEKRTARYFLSTAWTYYADIDEVTPAVTDGRTSLELMPEPERFIERISDIAQESTEERHDAKETEEPVVFPEVSNTVQKTEVSTENDETPVEDVPPAISIVEPEPVAKAPASPAEDNEKAAKDSPITISLTGPTPGAKPYHLDFEKLEATAKAEDKAEETLPAATQHPVSPVSAENKADDKDIVVPPNNASNASNGVVIVDDDEDEPVFND